MIEEIKKRIMPGRVINIGMETTQQDSNYILWLYREHERLSSRLERYETALGELSRADDSALIEHPHEMSGIAKEALKGEQ